MIDVGAVVVLLALCASIWLALSAVQLLVMIAWVQWQARKTRRG